jgi:subtilisin family serine protease
MLSTGVPDLGRLAVDRPSYDGSPVLGVARVPGDARFGEQWDLRNTGQSGGTPGADVHAPQAWDVTTGGRGVLVSVMDTGVDYTHPDLYQNIWINQAEIPASRRANLVDVDGDGLITFADLNDPINQGAFKIRPASPGARVTAADILKPMVRDAQGNDTGEGGWAYPGNTQDGDTAHPNDFIGWNFVKNNNDPMDDNGHGTHVSGTIAAQGDNGAGVAGLDWQAQIMPVKFLGADGKGGLGTFIAALNYAVAHGARISNNSWEGAGNSRVLDDALRNARNHGHILVAAAGNKGANNDATNPYLTGVRSDNVVSVAASDRQDRLASFSDYGARSVDLAAPGVDILSTRPHNSYGVMNGTSMAAPHVTGVLALVWGLHPDWGYRQVINQVLNTVDKVAGLQGKTATGGRLDAAAAVGADAAGRSADGGTATRAAAVGAAPADRTGPGAPAASAAFSVTTPRPVAPGGRAVSALAVDRDLAIGSVTVCVNVTRPLDGDLRLHLQAPDGSDFVLADARGPSGHGAEVSLAGLEGRNARGTWKLWVESHAPGAPGMLDGWSLRVTPGGAPAGMA